MSDYAKVNLGSTMVFFDDVVDTTTGEVIDVPEIKDEVVLLIRGRVSKRGKQLASGGGTVRTLGLAVDTVMVQKIFPANQPALALDVT